MPVDLPKDFETLEPFTGWALAAQDERQARRIAASTGELCAFYNTILPLLPKLLAYVDKYPLGELPESVRPLFWMLLSLAEIAPHVELYRGDSHVPYSFDETRFVAEHGQVAA
jgi:hypothetical protein